MSEKAKRRDTAALIAAELDRVDTPLTAYELLEKLRPTGVFAPTTVYRALDKLLASRRIHRIESLNAFVACRAVEGGPHDHGHGHGHGELGTGFTVCDRCAAVAGFEDPALQACIAAAAAAGGFLPRSSVVEIRGLCAACSAAARDDAGPR